MGNENTAPSYTKDQFKSSQLFTDQQKDVLNALLQEDEAYTIDQVKTMIDKFMRKAVQ